MFSPQKNISNLDADAMLVSWQPRLKLTMASLNVNVDHGDVDKCFQCKNSGTSWYTWYGQSLTGWFIVIE